MSIQTRFSSIIHPALSNQRLHIFGCGAIGSNVAIHSDKMGIENFTLYDFDKVEQPNIGVTPYKMQDIGRLKTDALKDMITPTSQVKVIDKKITSQTKLVGIKGAIAILAFDNMEARLMVAEMICNAKAKLLIDGRMGAEMFQMYILPKPEIKQYKQFWYSDKEGSQEPCTAKATPWCSSLTGSFISNALSKIISGHPCPTELFFHFPSMTMDWK
tara:strand:+ start:1357 stop:2001 length:645 start_codon:yes stop_codon:yes gene_type:complete